MFGFYENNEDIHENIVYSLKIFREFGSVYFIT